MTERGSRCSIFVVRYRITGTTELLEQTVLAHGGAKARKIVARTTVRPGVGIDIISHEEKRR